MMRSALEWKKYYSSKEFLDNYLYDGADLGVKCTEHGTTFRLWSPMAERVTLNFYDMGNGGDLLSRIPMSREEKGVWSYEDKRELHGVYYDFTLVIEGEEIRSADPYARACGVNGNRSMVVDLRKTDPEGWDKDQTPKKQEETIVYELHVKEFSWDKSGGFPENYRGKYKAFTCVDTTLNQDGKHATGLKYLKDLGVTHLQLMPVYDYGSVDEAGDDSAFNWGYDPMNYNVPEGSYATDAEHGEVRIREFKEMIQSIHKQGFGVIMDVVYNHTYCLDTSLQHTAPWYYYRMFEDGKISDGSACGNDIASERYMCGKYILESVLYWVEEYHIDGFRFDLMGLLDVELMNRIRKELDDRYGKGTIILYGEPWAAAETAMEGNAVPATKANIHLLDENIGIFCDNTRDTIKGSALRGKEPGFINGACGLEAQMLQSAGAWCMDPPKESGICGVKSPQQIVTYVSAHDNHTLWDKLKETIEDEEECMRLNRMAAAVYMTCQGVLFFLSGEEFARTKDGHDNTFRSPITLNRLDWNLAWKNEELVEYYKGLIALRKQCPGLCDKSTDSAKRIHNMWGKDGIVSFYVDNIQDKAEKDGSDRWQELKVIYNSTKKGMKVHLGQENGWKLLCDAKSSWLWKEDISAGECFEIEPQSVAVFGRS